MRRKLGDRRIRPRFDIVGDLWGRSRASCAYRCGTSGGTGRWIHSHVPLSSGSVHRLTLETARTAAHRPGPGAAQVEAEQYTTASARI